MTDRTEDSPPLPTPEAVGMDGTGRPWLTAGLGWLVLAGLLAVLYSDVIVGMARTWLNTTTYNHGFLVFPIALILIWLRRHALAKLTPRIEPAALVLIALGTLGWLLGRAADVRLVENTALVGLLVSTIILMFGRRIALTIWFPLLFMFFMVPAGDFLVPGLQDITARFAVGFLRVFDIPVFLDGILIYVPNGVFEVAEACAGIRFLIANIVIAALFAHLAYTRWWKAAGFMVLSVIIPIIANGFRALGILLIAYHTDNAYAVGVDHLIYGWGFFALVMLIILWIGNLFADRRIGDVSREPVTIGERTRPATARPVAAMTVLAVALIGTGPTYAQAVMGPPAGFDRLALTLAPPRHATLTAEDARQSDWQPTFPGADRIVHVRYDGAAAPVDFYMAYYGYQRQRSEVVYFANRLYDNRIWLRLQSGRHAVTAPGTPAMARTERIGGPSRQRLVTYWYWVGGAFTIDPVDAKIRQTIAKLTGRHPQAALIALAADFDEDPQVAIRRIEAVAAGLEPLDGYLQGLGQ